MSSCNAAGCDKPRRAGQLMCGHHWAMVPPERQRLIYKPYREGRADTFALMRNTTYLEVVAVAIEHVAAQEGRSQANSWRNLLTIRQTALALDRATAGK